MALEISIKLHQTETPDLKHTVTLEGDDSERFDEYPMDRAYLLDANQLKCRITLLHTHGTKRQEYTSHKTR